MSTTTSGTAKGGAEVEKNAAKDQAEQGRSAPTSRRRLPFPSAQQLKKGQAYVRSRIAALVSAAAMVCAAVLAIGALLVALDANPANSVVRWFTDTATWLAGPLHDVFRFTEDNGRPHQAKNALANWGIAAVAYLVVGKIVSRIIGP